MGCVIEFDSNIRFNFVQNTRKQKIMIDVLLRYTQLDLSCIAEILNLDMHTLRDVHAGGSFLKKNQAEDLGKLVILILSE